MSEEYDSLYDYEEAPVSSRPSNKPFIIAMAVLGAILILGLAVMAVWVWGQTQESPDGFLAFLDLAPEKSVDVAVTSTPLENAVPVGMTNTPTWQPTATLSPADLVAGTEGAEETAGESTAAEPGGEAGEEEVSAEQTEESGEDVLVSQTTPGSPASGLPDEARTATVAALLTAAAESQDTPEPEPTELPETGFVDEIGLPVLGGLALLLMVVIILVRRLRHLSA